MSTEDMDQPVGHGDSGRIITGIKGIFETYPVVKECPECGSDSGYQSFDIWVCSNCGKWPGIEPIEVTDGTD